MREEAENERRRDETCFHAATIIQSVWRSYRVRKQIKNKEKLRGQKNQKKAKGKNKKKSMKKIN